MKKPIKHRKHWATVINDTGVVLSIWPSKRQADCHTNELSSWRERGWCRTEAVWTCGKKWAK